MAVDATVVADSGSEIQAAPSEAAGTTDPTHGEPTEHVADTSTEGDAPPPADESGDESDAEFEEKIKDLSEDEQKTKSQERRERRQKREAERIQKERETAVEAYKREQETKAATEKAAADHKAATEAFFTEFGAYVGTPEARTTLDAEIADLSAEIAGMRPYADGTDLDVLEQKQTALQEKVTRRAELNRNKETYDKIDAFQFRMAQAEWATGAASLPAEHQQRYLGATSIPELLKIHEDGIVAREASKHKATLDASVAEWSGKLAKEEAAHAATRTGAPGTGPAPNGSNGTGGATGILTPERYAGMTTEERQKLRSTPEGRRQIDEMSRRRTGFGQRSA